MRLFAAFILALVFMVTAPAMAHDGEKHEVDETNKAVDAIVGEPEAGAEEKARKYFTDLAVVTQDGEELRFFSDVLKDRVVVVSLFYTQCTGSCPVNNQRLAVMQEILGDAMGRDYFFVSVSLDPETDTPEVLKEYAKSFDAGKGWYFLTGEPKNLHQITRRLGQVNEDIAAHSPFFMLGNVPKAHWSRVAPNVPPDGVISRLRLISGEFATQ
jgi:cytochrome oxidase Cu insertion factor (SCO1/SenC/PrrC family)